MYLRLCKGLADKGKLLPVNVDLSDIYTQIDKRKDHYVSLFQFNSSHYDKFLKEGTVSGITDVVSNRLTWDFDSRDNVELAKQEAIMLTKRLLNLGYTAEEIQCYFSGNKGFEVTVELATDYITPSQMKNICLGVAEGLTTVDPKIYNATRIMRLPLTKHQDSGLYKTPLTLVDLEDMSMNEIIEHSKQTMDYDEIKSAWRKAKLVSNLIKLKDTPKQEPIVKSIDSSEPLDLRMKPKWLSNWKYALSKGYYGSGMRNHALMILAATCKGGGFDENQTYYFLKAANQAQSDRFNCEKFSKQEIWNNIIKVVFCTTWKGGTYSEDNFPEDIKRFLLEHKIPRGDDISSQNELVENVADGFSDFVSYAQEIEKNTMKFGIPSLDAKLKVRKGHLIGITAPPGAGKTLTVTTIANNMSKLGTHVFFASYDMYKHNLYARLIQKHTGLHEDDIFKAFIKRDTTKIENFKKLLSDNYGNVSFCFNTGQSISQLKASIRERESKTGLPVDLVVVDYIELILSDKSDPTAASAEAAQGLREIANEGRVVIVLLQPNKMNSKPNKRITSYNAAKGSSAIAQAVTAMLTLHRPGLHSRLDPKFDRYLSLDCVKNRNGSLFSLDFYFDGNTTSISEIDDVGRVEIDMVRDMVRQLDNEENDDDI